MDQFSKKNVNLKEFLPTPSVKNNQKFYKSLPLRTLGVFYRIITQNTYSFSIIKHKFSESCYTTRS